MIDRLLNLKTPSVGVILTLALLTKEYDCPSTVVVNFVPLDIVREAPEALLTKTSIVAVEAVVLVGVYPTCFAFDTTLERKSALSINISFANIFALYPR